MGLPQLRVARMRENLIDAAARHHIAAQEHGHHATAHLPTEPQAADPGSRRRRVQPRVVSPWPGVRDESVPRGCC